MEIRELASELMAVQHDLTTFEPVRETAWPSPNVKLMSDRINRLDRPMRTSARDIYQSYRDCRITPFVGAFVAAKHYDLSVIRAYELDQVTRARKAIGKLISKVRVKVEASHPASHVTIVRGDFVNYESASKVVDDILGAQGIAAFQHAIRESFLFVLKDLGFDIAHALLKADGDCVWLRFAEANDALLFISSFAQARGPHSGKGEKLFPMKRFRIGAATGVLLADPLNDFIPDFAGMVMTTATRLEAAAEPGGALIDLDTWRSAKFEFQNLFLAPTEIDSKHGLRMVAAKFAAGAVA